MCHFYNVTLHFCKNIFFIIFKSLRSSVSEGILAVEEGLSKQEDIRKKKVCCAVYSQTWLSVIPFQHCGACGFSLGTLLIRA